jgi:hypothetical protein
LERREVGEEEWLPAGRAAIILLAAAQSSMPAGLAGLVIQLLVLFRSSPAAVAAEAPGL